MTMTVNVNRRVLGLPSGEYALYCRPASDLFEQTNATYVIFSIGPLDVPNNVFPDFESAMTHRDSDLIAALISNVDNSYGPGHIAGWIADGGVEKTIVRLDQLDTAVAQKLNATAIDSNAFVADAPTDAPQDLDTIATSLTALVGEVNASNTKQNEIAARLNEVVAALQEIGVLKVSP